MVDFPTEVTNTAPTFLVGGDAVTSQPAKAAITAKGRTLIAAADAEPFTAAEKAKLADLGSANTVTVASLADLPAPNAGAIQLAADTVYYIEGGVDLLGNRLVGAANTCLLGASSENASLTSTGLTSGVALFTTDYTTPIRHLTFKNVHTCFNIDGSRSGQTPALDWTGVNFVNIPVVGTIRNFDNWIYTKGAFLGAQGLVLGGNVGTAGADNCIFNGTGFTGSIITVAADAVISRRFRVVYSSIIVPTGSTGVDFNVGASVPNESYILDTVNFSGAGTYTAGVAYSDNKARFTGVRGVPNSAEVAHIYKTNGVLVTDVVDVGVPVKINIVTAAGPATQRFTATNNRATYVGTLTRYFEVTAHASFTSGNNRTIGLYIAKNGAVLPESEMYATTSSAGKAEAISLQVAVQLATNDYLEVWIENASTTEDITVEHLSMIVKGIGA